MLQASAQVVDRVRLGYTGSASDQVGLAASPDGASIAFVYKDKTIKIFDVTASRFTQRFTASFTEIFDVRLTNDGKLILIEPGKVTILLWKTGETAKSFPLEFDATKVDFAPNAQRLAVGQMQGVVTIYDVNEMVEIRKITYAKHHVSALALSPDGKRVAVGVMATLRKQNPIQLFEIATGNVLTETPKGFYTVANFSQNGDQLFVGGWNSMISKKVVKVLDGNTLAPMREFTNTLNVVNMSAPYSCVQYGSKALTATVAKSLDVYDMNSGGIVFTTRADAIKSTPFWTMGIGPAKIFPLGKEGKFIMNVSGNNINQIYDAKSNAIIGYFYSDSDDDFSIVARDGRVDGTAHALSRVYWTAKSSSGRTSLESTFEKSYTPRLLPAMLSQVGDESPAFEVDEVLEKIPVLELKSFNGELPNKGEPATGFASKHKKSTVVIAVAKNLEETNEVKLFQNSKLIKAIKNSGQNTFTFEVSLSKAFGEENYFYATATSKSGIEAEKVKFVVTYQGADEGQPTLYLITIGINEYKNPKYNLNYAIADADAVEKAVQERSASLFGRIVPFHIRNSEVVRSKIQSVFEEIRNQSKEQDMLIVYYAGHGVMSSGAVKDAEFFIIPYDVTQLYGKDEMLYEKATSASEIKEYAGAINAQKQVFIIDACQSAGVLETVATRGAAEEKAIAQLARSTGSFWITSTGSDQFATEFAKLGHGIFTYALIEALQGTGDGNHDKKLTVREMSSFIENRVPELSEQYKGAPQFPSVYSFGNDFPLAVFDK